MPITSVSLRSPTSPVRHLGAALAQDAVNPGRDHLAALNGREPLLLGA